MVKGLDVFRDYFKSFTDQYVLIGGAACDLQFAEVEREFRATHDLDIVLSVEAFSPEFGRAFWDFIRVGGYGISQRSDGEKQFYRFRKPQNPAFPACLELFSRRLVDLNIPSGVHLTPIPVGEDVSSLSAILLDDDYAALIREEMQIVKGVPVVSVTGLVILKARAWMDLRYRKRQGEHVDSKDIKKHRTDIVNLIPYMIPRTDFSEKLRADLIAFLAEFEPELLLLQASGNKIDLNTISLLRAALNI